MIEFLPKQNECLRALSLDEAHEVVLFGGAAGGSKSFTGCAWQVMRRLKYPGTRGLIGRSKLDSLKKTTLRTFFEVAKMMGLISQVDYRFNGVSNTIIFYNGSEIILKDLFQYPSDGNFDSLGSLEITDWFVDEASQVNRRAIDVLRSRVRYKLVEYNLQPKGLLTCNPTKGWLYQEFYAPWRDQCLPSHYTFIQAKPSDNPYLPPSYERTLSLLPEMDRRRLLEGDWEYDEASDHLFKTDDVLACFRQPEITGTLYITADIARLGKDRTVICVWRGLSLVDIYEMRKARVTEVSQKILQLMTNHAIPANQVIIDEDGVGGGVSDIVRGSRGFRNGSKAIHPLRFINLKAECYFKLAEYVEQSKIVFPMAFRDVIAKELDMIRRSKPDADTKLSVIGKDEISREHGVSPDYADAIMMRMYVELRPNYGKYSYI